MAFGDFLGTKLIYEKLPGGDTTFSEIPGTMSSFFGNPMTYERTYNNTPKITQYDSAIGPQQYSAPSSYSSPYVAPQSTNSNADTLSTLQGAQSSLDRLSAELERRKSATGEPTLGSIFSAPQLYSYEDTPDRTLSASEERAIRRRQMQLFQSEIDATNEIYDQMIREAQMEGKGRLGSQRASAARGGLLGSDFAGAQKDKVQKFNSEILAGIYAQQAAAIAAIEGKGRASAVDEINRLNQIKSQEADDYLSDLGARQQVQASNISYVAQAMIDQGFTPEQIEDELTGIASEIGTTPEAIKAEYFRLQLPEAGGDQFTLGSNEKRFDAQGNLIAEGGSGSGTIYSTSKGLVRVNPKTGEAELIYGTGGSGGSGVTASFTSSELKKLEQAGKSNAPRQEQLDFLYGDDTVAGEDLGAFRDYLAENRNVSPEILRQDLLSQGLSVSMTNSLLNTRPLSDQDAGDMAQNLLVELIEPKALSLKGTELEVAKQKAREEVEAMLQGAETFDAFGRMHQLSQEDANLILSYIDGYSGAADAQSIKDLK